MDKQDSLEAQLEAANRSLRQLQAQLKVSERQFSRILEVLDHQQAQLTSQATSLSRLDRIQMEMLTGKTWRTLRAAGDLMKKIVPSKRPLGAVAAMVNGRRSYLVCDGPNVNDDTPLSGDITIRGWCLAETGVDTVQVEIKGLPRMEKSPGVPRPDVKKAFPELDKSGRAGFEVEFDSLKVPNGRYPVTIRSISGGLIIHEIKKVILIDHERGFSSDYGRWIFEFERAQDDLVQLKLIALQSRPLISIVMPVYNTDSEELTAAIQSVIDQSYSNWELCIADDASTKPVIAEILNNFAQRDSRIRLRFEQKNGGISKTANAAAQISTGDYLCFLDHDDTLAPNALAHVCAALDKTPEADLLYSDEDKIDGRGKRFEPFFKPDWSPDLLLSENYICHLLVLRRDLVEKIGDLNPDCDGSQDYDLILRATSAAEMIVHIPHVLYHWRAGVASTASGIGNKQYAIDAAREALQRHCDRIGTNLKVEPGTIQGRWRVRYPIPPDLRVSVIIASGGNAEVLQTNLESIFSKTTFANYEVVVIDNSKQLLIERLVRTFKAPKQKLRYINWRNQPFNYSRINNAAASQCASPALLFLNDDTSLIEPSSIEAMAELIGRPEVGVVGAKLLYPDERIQHGGVVMGLYDNCGHAFKGLDGKEQHYFDFPDVIRNVSAVTGACLMTKRDIFMEVGGFDEISFAVAFNDIDLCLKIADKGYRVLYTPHALLYHYEAFSKTSKDLVPHPAEVDEMRKKWRAVIAADPFYSPNLSRNEEDYSFRKKLAGSSPTRAIDDRRSA